MKIRVKPSTITALNNLKNLWLFRGKDILIIRDFTYEKVKPEEIPTEPNTVVRKKRRNWKPDTSEKLYETFPSECGNLPELDFLMWCER